MYFKEKEDTNIDSEFESNKKINLDFKKLKPILLIGGGILLLLIIIIIIAVIVSNSDKATIELIGSENITINLGEDYIEPGYKAYDKDEKDVTNTVKITSDLDTSKVGKYEILYSITGASKVRYISVVQNKSTYIRLKGDITMYLKVGDKYNEPGYDLYDTVDSKDYLSSKLVISGSVNTSKKGIYEIVYSVTNSRNESTTAKRIVVVE